MNMMDSRYHPGDPQARFGAHLREKRQSLGLSQEGLAARAGLHRTYVGSVERGERNVSLLNILKLARALRCNAGELLDFVDEE